MTREVKEYICASIDEGKTLQQIVDGIEEIFNTRTTKQNVSKFCKQYREKYEKDLEVALDVINVYIRAGFYNHLGRTELLRGISLYKVKTYLTDYKYLYDSERIKFYNMYCKCADAGMDTASIRKALEYKGIEPNNYVLDKLKMDREIDKRYKTSASVKESDSDL